MFLLTKFQPVFAKIKRFSSFFQKKTGMVVLGRWALDECPKRIDRKVDWANEDHCGPCGHNPVIQSKSSMDRQTSSNQ